MWYIEWYKSEGSRGTTKGRFAVYFNDHNAAYEAMRGWLLDNNVDGFDVKQKL